MKKQKKIIAKPGPRQQEGDAPEAAARPAFKYKRPKTRPVAGKKQSVGKVAKPRAKKKPAPKKARARPSNRRDPMSGLTAQQDAFCREFVLCGGNASEAYRRAYKSLKMKDDTVHRRAHDILKNGKVQARLEQLQGAAREIVEKKFGETMESLIARQVAIADLDVADVLDYGVREVTRKTKDGGEYTVRETYAEAVPLSRLSPEMRRIVQVDMHVTHSGRAVPVVRIPDRQKALDQLMRMQGMEPPKRIEFTGTDAADLLKRLHALDSEEPSEG